MKCLIHLRNGERRYPHNWNERIDRGRKLKYGNVARGQQRGEPQLFTILRRQWLGGGQPGSRVVVDLDVRKVIVYEFGCGG